MHGHYVVATSVSAFQQRKVHLLVKFLPIMQGVEYFVRGVLLKVAESGNIFAVEDEQGLFEVVVREVGDESHLLFVLLGELLY